MLFNSVNFIFYFLPIVVIGYFFLNKCRFIVAAKIYLVIASLFFYGYWNIKYLPLILISVLFNFTVGSILNTNLKKYIITRKQVLIFGIIVNILILGYYKYYDFFISNINIILKTHIPLLNIVLPLAISFFTFQQISYLIDSYYRKTKEDDFLSYTLFVTFFPQLIAGPIVRHCEIMPQFKNIKTIVINWKNCCQGIFIFIIGLSKKVLIADSLAVWAAQGYSNASEITILHAWIAILSYTFQIYYDFSGYTDMAIGIGKMFNINLPVNFNNPYQAKSIEDFWRRWHISLSRFLKDYLYKPMLNFFSTKNVSFNYKYLAIIVVFFISGLWHGASWLFVLWGLSHGVINIINKYLRDKNININNKISWILTFFYLNLTWILFKSENLNTAKNMILSAFGQNGFAIPKIYKSEIHFIGSSGDHITSAFSLIVLPLLTIFIFYPIFNKLKDNFKPNKKYLLCIILLFLLCIFVITMPDVKSPFIYFNF